MKLRVYFDRKGNTLSVWFDDPKKEHVCEEPDDDVVLVKDRRGRVIGFERLNFLSPKQRREGAEIPLEIQMASPTFKAANCDLKRNRPRGTRSLSKTILAVELDIAIC